MSADPHAALVGRPVAAEDPLAFLRVYGHLFEHSPWVVERAWAHRPFADAGALAAAFEAAIAAATPDEQRALALAHPELADRLAIAAGALTAASAAEQAGAGLDRLSPEQFEMFQALNRAYRERFGIPFIICVRLHDLAGIEAALRRRLESDPDAELAEAMRQVGLIGALRLADVTPPEGLARQSERVRYDLDCLALPGPWLPEETTAQGQPILDVVIVGAGQCGLSAAFGLIREGVRNILVVDENPPGLEGPWGVYARMVTLRTPKALAPIDFGLASLTPRAWWEAQYGRASWAALGKIPKEDWLRYLVWYREVLDLPVRNHARVERIEPLGGRLFEVRLAGEAPLIARKVILATGIQGGGDWHTPDFVREALPAGRYAHTADAIDFEALKGKRVAILGGGASAFDNAQHALAAGAGSVDVFMRRADFPRVNPIRYLERVGILRNFPLLDDARKYGVITDFLGRAQPPTNDTFGRACAYPNFTLHTGAGWDSVGDTGAAVRVETAKGAFEFDFLILSTGTRTDLSLRPELAAVQEDVLLWRDRYRPPDGEAHPLIDDHPYLGPGFELTPKTETARERLHGLFVFNYSALASLGLSASALSGVRPALPRLAAAVAGQLFLDRQDQFLQAYRDYDEVEFEGRWPAD